MRFRGPQALTDTSVIQAQPEDVPGTTRKPEAEAALRFEKLGV